MPINKFLNKYAQKPNTSYKSIWYRIHIDPLLLIGLCLLLVYGLMVLLSASNGDADVIYKQLGRIVLGFVFMFVCAQIPPEKYRLWVPWIYGVGIVLLLCVLVFGHIGKGAQRWINLGLFRFQPSEFMKIAVPIMIAWYLGEKELPPRIKPLCVSVLLMLIPALLIAKQPDLGTALVIMIAGAGVILFAGINWRLLLSVLTILIISAPILWHFMHDYQRERVLTFLNPDRDPLGTGYHIIQSKIAIGSGGFFGKGWFNGTQSHLDFLPEHSTDFIFSVLGEEFGLIGAIILLILYSLVVARALQIAYRATDNFTRLVAGSLAFTFFLSVFVNIGMVCGILPVVGLPLPLISYGGTSIVTVLAGFGILMSIQTHKRIVRQ
jgi:rod shape determining protein RodA